MRGHGRALCALVVGVVVASAASYAMAYDARVRWSSSPDPDVTGYRIYRRLQGGTYGAGQDVGKPPTGTDGSLSVQVTTLDARTDYAFAVTAYTATASESGLSNEILLGYAQVAPLIDSDGDGLTDAQEDTNLNRVVDANETDPTKADTDGDGVGDRTDLCKGTAVGAAVNAVGCSCAQITCSNGNPCDGVEGCTAGVCTPGTPPTCDDGNACTIDGCSPTTGCTHSAIPGCVPCTTAAQCNDGDPCSIDTCNAGQCAHAAAPNGSSCSDGNACNGAETCQSGICRAGTPLTCNDSNPCTTDSCNPASGCVFTNNTNPCADDGNVCTADVCSGGACMHPSLADGAPCPDGTVCNGEESCQAGTCRPGPVLDCDDGNACTTDSCGATTGCAHTAIPGCATCTSAGQCGDSNPCTADACVDGKCQYGPLADGASCSDGNACNGAETCQSGTCRAGTPLTCNDSNPCTNDSCDPASGCLFTPNANPCTDDGNVCTSDVCSGGTCTHPAKANGLACGDGNPCNGNETCQSGTCAPGTPVSCNDNDACTTDSCSPTSGCVHTPIPGCSGCTSDAQCADADPCTRDTCSTGVCSHSVAANGTSCSDGNLCNGLETCRAGVCTPGTALTCNDGNPCTTDSCDPTTGCTTTNNTNTCADDGNACTDDVCGGGTCTHPAKANGASCGDGNACNGVETCQGGTCRAGTPPVCNDSNPCTNDSCNPATGCVFANNTAPCADDGNQCTNDVCSAGTCTHPAKTDGTTCSDGLYCTVADVCRAGTCTGGTANCAGYATACKNAACDETRHRCYGDFKPYGTPCGDTNPCNGTEVCDRGSCVSGRALNCDDGNPCTTDRCDPVAGCVHTSVADGTSCGDGQFCNGAETCQAGVCTPPAAPPCADESVCTTDTCDEKRKRCSHDPIPGCCVTDADCVDADACTINERCEAGQCVSDPLACPAAAGPCEVSACDPALGCTTSERPNGTACEDGDPCTRGEKCKAGACGLFVSGLPTEAAEGAPGGDLIVTQFLLKTTKKGVRLTGTASFLWGTTPDPTASGIRIEIRSGAASDLLYGLDVPGNVFATNRAHTRFVFSPRGAEAAAYGGLVRLMLKATGGGMDVSVKAMLPPSAATVVTSSAPAASRSDNKVAWAIWFGSDCVSDPNLSCQDGKGRSRRCQ